MSTNKKGAVKSPSTVKVLNLSDQGGYILPKISESSRSRKAWVNYGITSADDFFTELIKAYETSPTNQACIDSSTDLIYGKGIEAKSQKALEDYLYLRGGDLYIQNVDTGQGTGNLIGTILGLNATRVGYAQLSVDNQGHDGLIGTINAKPSTTIYGF